MTGRRYDGPPRNRRALEQRLRNVIPDTQLQQRALRQLGYVALVATLPRHARDELDGEQLAAVDAETWREKLDQLAAVVVHTLVSANPRALSVEKVARECERDPGVYEEREEIELALRRLLIDGLAVRRDRRWTATRPAVRAQELSF